MSSTLPPTKLRVLIVRHGETRENVERIIQGQLDTDLNDRGRLQAEATGRFLSNIQIDRVITSPLKRTADTARAISKHHPHLELELEDRLKERAFGVLEGHVYNGAAKKPEDTEGIERMEPLSERLGSFWNDLVTRTVKDGERKVGSEAKEETETVVLVSHGGAISALMNQVLVAGRYCLVPPNVAPSRFWNCSITELLVPVIHTSGPSNTAPGALSRKDDWSIRPIHLGVQGSQFVLDHELQKRLLAQASAAAAAAAAATDPDATKELETVVKKTEAEFERDPQGRRQLEQDTIRAPDGSTVENDIGYGKGIGVVLQWSNVDHLKDMDEHQLSSSSTTASGNASSRNVNVDELVK